MASDSSSNVPQSSLFTALDKLEEQVTCGVCNEQFTDPRTLPCLHSFCLECIRKTFVNLKETRSCVGTEYLIRCPLCKKFAISSDPQGQSLPRAHHLTDLIEVKQDFFIPLTYHISSSLCSRHNEEIKLYCVQCSVGVCLECTVNDHAHHELRRLRLSELYLPEDGEEDGWIKVNHPLLTSLNTWPRPPEAPPLPDRLNHPRIDEGSMERHSSQETIVSGEGEVQDNNDKPYSRVIGLPSFRQYSHGGASVGGPSSTGTSTHTYSTFQQYSHQSGSNTTIQSTGTSSTTGGKPVNSRPAHTSTAASNNSDNIFQVILNEYDLVRT